MLKATGTFTEKGQTSKCCFPLSSYFELKSWNRKEQPGDQWRLDM